MDFRPVHVWFVVFISGHLSIGPVDVCTLDHNLAQQFSIVHVLRILAVLDPPLASRVDRLLVAVPVYLLD